MPKSFEDKYDGKQSIGSMLSNRFNDIKEEIKVQLPCKVVSIDYVNNQVDLEILDYDYNEKGELVNYPIIPNVPIRQPMYSGSAYVVLPVRVGDIGTIEFFDSSVDDLIATGNYEFDYTEEWHSINNGLFTNGFLPKNKLFRYNPEDDIIIGLHDTETKITLRGYALLREVMPEFNPSDFDTKLTDSQEIEYQSWLTNMINKGLIVFDAYPEYDYDFRGAWLNGHYPKKVGEHWVDTYKKPNHETFSTYSKYATGEYLKYAGTWDGDKFNMPKSRKIPVVNIVNDGSVVINANNIVTNCKTATLHADNYNITSNINVSGDIHATGTITADTEVVGAGKNLSTHTHTGNQGSPTSPPN